MQNYNSKLKIYLAVAVFIIIFVIIIVWRGSDQVQAGPLDNFAQCLTDKGVIMYGANWCSHCQNEKKAFGNSFSKVNYVECPKDPKKCLDMGVEGYPTWIFGDGKKLVGEQGVQKLAQESGCALPEK